MTLVTPNVSEILVLKYILNVIDPGNPVLRLFTDNITPDESTIVASLNEPVGIGYAAITLGTPASWTFATVTDVTTASYPLQTFTLTGAVNLYGYYITDTSGNLLWLERFAGAPFPLGVGGGNIEIIPKTQLD